MTDMSCSGSQLLVAKCYRLPFQRKLRGHSILPLMIHGLSFKVGSVRLKMKLFFQLIYCS